MAAPLSQDEITQLRTALSLIEAVDANRPDPEPNVELEPVLSRFRIRGSLTMLNINPPYPKASSAWCPYLAAADSTNHLAIPMFPSMDTAALVRHINWRRIRWVVPTV
jgi:hypothetical protein